MKILLKLLPLFLLFTSCSFFEENETEKLSAELSLNLEVYTTGGSDEITASVVVYGGTGNHEISWKAGDGEYKEGSDTKDFGVYDDSKFQIFYCRIVDGEDTVYKNKKAESTASINNTPVNRYGRLKVDGTQLVDEHGFPVQLRGMSSHGIQYYPNFYNENLVQSLAEHWKVDVFRISSYVNEGKWNPKGTYLDNKEYWRSYIDDLVDYAGKHGIYALIDWHMLYPGDPNVFVEEAEEFWRHMVNEHGDKKHVLFDICNEPNDMENWDKDGYTVSWSMIKKYADRIMPIIREKSENIAIVGTPKWASRPNDVIGNKLSYSNVMYTMHFYAADHGEGYMNNVRSALEGGIPVFVTEFGTQSATGGSSNDFKQSKAWLDFLNENQISWINWNISPDYLSGAAFIEDYYPSSVEEYADTTKMKAAGKWIMKQIQDR